MKSIQELHSTTNRNIKMVQFGEGNFLRAFVDYMVDVANEKNLMDCGIAILKPIPFGDLNRFDAQKNLFTVSLRGKQDGETYVENRVVTSVVKTVDCYSQYEDYAALARLDTLEFVVSNTTEAGIAYDENDQIQLKPPNTFPGKLTKFLFDRFTAFNGSADKGLVILPVELIENNGGKLRACVMQYIDLWNLGDAFHAWVSTHCVFCSTLVDRIVTGYPHEEAAEICESLGYEDNLLDAAEPFGLWVIESETDISKRLPLDQAGQPVVFTADQKPYRERKVRILNGAHTSTVLAAYLTGKDTVLECMNDATIRKFMEQTVIGEIVPTVRLPREEAIAFADSVFERFENPFVKHALLSISLNSVSKWKSRILPTFRDHYQATGNIPTRLSFSFAALMAFYSSAEEKDGALIGHRGEQPYEIRDDKAVLDFFAANSQKSAREFTQALASNEAFWGEDLCAYTGFVDFVSSHLEAIRSEGMETVMKRLIAE